MGVTILVSVILAGCGLGAGDGGDQPISLAGRIALPTGTGAQLTVSGVDVTGQLDSQVCEGVLSADTFVCDAPESAFDSAYFLISYTVDLAPPLTFQALISPDDESPVVISSLGNLVSRRARQLMATGAAATPALDEAQSEASAALGGLDVGDDAVVEAYEEAILRQAQSSGLADARVLSDQYAQDFAPDENFSQSGFFDLGTLLQASLGLPSLTLDAAPPPPRGLAFLLIQPLVVATTRDVLVSWSNAYADDYSLTVTSDAAGSGGFSFLVTGTSQLVSGLTPGQTYYIFLSANVGTATLLPIGGVSSFRVASDAQ